MGLNEQQAAVVAAPAEGVIQVCALAGTGKSHTVIHRNQRLLTGNDKTSLILAFNKRIQLEMAQKVSDKLPKEIARRTTVQTSHSFALQMVKTFITELEHLIPTPVIEVLSQDWKVQKRAKEVLIAKRVPLQRGELQPVAKALIAIGDLHRSVAPEDYYRLSMRFQRALSPLFEVDITDPLPLAKAIYLDRYESGQLAFSDMIPLAVELPDRCFSQMGFNYVMVDEAQDLNLIQHRMVEKLYRAGEGLTIVGDFYQSIYSFTGAAPHVFLESPKRYGAKVFPMEWNYRSSPRILDFANSLLKDALAATLELKPGREDLEPYPHPWIMSKSQTMMGWLRYMQDVNQTPLSEIAILYRMNSQSLKLELDLISNKIPYQAKTGGFLSLPPVRDLLSYLMMVLAPMEEWWDTVVSHWQYLGKDTANASFGECLFSAVKQPWKTTPSTLRNSGMKSAWQELRVFMDGLTQAVQPGKGLRGVVDGLMLRLQPYWADKYADDPDALADALSIGNATAEWLGNLKDCSELLDVMNNRRKLTSDNGVTLSTIHRAKGLEWDAVLVHGLGDSTFIRVTNDISDEEFRLAYVAFTRAKKYLTLGIDETSDNGGILAIHLRSVLYPDTADPMTTELDDQLDPTVDLVEAA